MTFEEGPYVQVACFCEMVIKDDTNALSLIRIVDRITHVERGSNPPEDMPPVLYQLKLVLGFKSGMARGRNSIRIIPRKPDGSSGDTLNLTIHFEGEERGAFSIVDFRYTFTEEGLYWFYTYIGEEFVTAIPIRLIYIRQVVGTSS